MVTLAQLGPRIAIIGCSNSGKSTLAHALAKKLHIPAYHLDQYAHQAHSNWQRQPDSFLIAQHQQIIKQEHWIIEGNYNICMKERFERATAVIWLDFNVWKCAWRYLLRSIKNDPKRPGKLLGAANEFNLSLLKWIIWNYPKNRNKYQNLLAQYPELTCVKIASLRMLKKYYKFWQISVISGSNDSHLK